MLRFIQACITLTIPIQLPNAHELIVNFRLQKNIRATGYGRGHILLHLHGTLHNQKGGTSLQREV